MGADNNCNNYKLLLRPTCCVQNDRISLETDISSERFFTVTLVVVVIVNKGG
jgi:hypothetical protein